MKSLNNLFTSLFSKKNKNKNAKLNKDELIQKSIDFLNKNLAKTEGILKSTQPKVFSMAEESNIACKYNDFLLCTKDGNLVLGIKLNGYSYAASNEEEELSLAMLRNQFFIRLKDDIELNIIIKKEKVNISNDSSTVKNPYAKEIIDKWDTRASAFKLFYYLIVSTKSKNLTGLFETVKEKSTQEKIQKEEKEQAKVKFHLKERILDEIRINIFNDLAMFEPNMLSSNDLINIFANYANANNVNISHSFGLLTDSYLSSDVEFKKDYMIFERNDSKTIYQRFLSVKSYETDNISSLINTSILRENSEFLIFIHCEALGKEKAIKKIKDTILTAQDIVRDELLNLMELVKADRESLILVSYSVLIGAESLEELNDKTNLIKGLLENQSLNIVKETLNQKPLFFSFFPSRGNLNVRVRALQAKNLSTIVSFENDILGFKKNSWGDKPVTIFKHLSGSPFLFNFHESEDENALGHTLIIGGTGAGKTTLTQFLMLNLFRYDINIFAMDKLRGMCNFVTYLGCEYHDLDENEEGGLSGFKLNPFSLEDSRENNLFLVSWLCKMAGIEQGKDFELEGIVEKALISLRNIEKHNKNTFEHFYNALTKPNEGDVNIRFKRFRKSLFDNEEDALNFDKQLSILNMDAIIKNERLAGLSALYIFHKIKNISKKSGKGFFIFIDELKDYLNDETMRKNILESILEVRKLNGVVTMGVQNLDFFDGVSSSNSFLSNMANYIIFPTSNEKTLEELEAKINLSGSELDFLRKTPKESRKVLFKQQNINKSAILDVNFARLGEHLRVFSSNSSDVKLLKDLKTKYPNEYRQRYLKKLKD